MQIYASTSLDILALSLSIPGYPKFAPSGSLVDAACPQFVPACQCLVLCVAYLVNNPKTTFGWVSSQDLDIFFFKIEISEYNIKWYI